MKKAKLKELIKSSLLEDDYLEDDPKAVEALEDAEDAEEMDSIAEADAIVEAWSSKRIHEAENAPGQVKGQINLNLFKKLGIEDPTKFTAAINLVKQGKPLGNIQNKALADVMAKLIKTSDDQLLSQIFQNLKNIEAIPSKGKVTENKQAGIQELKRILNDAAALGDEARQIFEMYFPNELRTAEAYDVFSFGSSSNSYDTTLASLIADMEEESDEE